MILFLDDDLGRTRIFKGYFPESKCVETAQEMIDMISNLNKIDVVFLDHDLGGESFVDSRRKDCGMEVIRWIFKNKPNIDKIVIHSMNLLAAEEMYETMKTANYDVEKMPFRTIDWNDIEDRFSEI